MTASYQRVFLCNVYDAYLESPIGEIGKPLAFRRRIKGVSVEYALKDVCWEGLFGMSICLTLAGLAFKSFRTIKSKHALAIPREGADPAGGIRCRTGAPPGTGPDE
jgi:hypothetical protein